MVAQWTDGELQVALLAIQGRTAYRMIVSWAPLEWLARTAGAKEALTDLDDWASIDAGRPHVSLVTSGSEREKTRRANIASFIP